jgi:hypothetical protein
MDPDDVDGKLLLAPARAIRLCRSCCQMFSRRESTLLFIVLQIVIWIRSVNAMQFLNSADLGCLSFKRLSKNWHLLAYLR